MLQHSSTGGGMDQIRRVFPSRTYCSWAVLLAFAIFSYADTVTATMSSWCFLSYKSDGDCDSFNNNAECDYDGGDCCECTCEDSSTYTCGNGGYDCLDPSSCPSEGSGSDLGVIIGATVGSLVALGIIISAVVFFYCRRVRTSGLPTRQAEHVVHTQQIGKASATVTAHPIQPSASKAPPPYVPPPAYEG